MWSKNLIFCLLVVGTVADAHAETRPIRRAVAKCWHYLLSGTPFVPKTLVDRLVAVKNLPSGFRDVVRKKGFARVTAQEGSLVTIEYVNERTMQKETMQISVDEVQTASSVQKWLYESGLKKAAMLAGKPDPTLDGKTVILDFLKPNYARVLQATQSHLHVEVLDGANLKTYAMTVVRPEELRHPTTKQANVFGTTLQIAAALENHPALRTGKHVLWTPNISGNVDLVPEEGYVQNELYVDDIHFPYERPFTLPDVPAIHIPLFYRQRPVPMRIDRLALEQGLVYVSGSNWSGALRLSVDLLRRSKFVEDEFAALYTLSDLGHEPFAAFRNQFTANRLQAGQAILDFANQPADPMNDPRETPEMDAYRVVYADENEVVLKNPSRTLNLTSARDLSRLALFAAERKETAEQAYVRKYGTTPIVADGAFVPNENDVRKFAFLREMRSIRVDLQKIGVTAEQVDHYAERITAVDAEKNLTAFSAGAPGWGTLLRTFHPDRPHFNDLAPSVRLFATEVFKLAGLARNRDQASSKQ